MNKTFTKNYIRYGLNTDNPLNKHACFIHLKKFEQDMLKHI